MSFLHKSLWITILICAMLIPQMPAQAQSNNCDAIIRSVDNHSADWGNWDSLIGRLQAKGCDYADVKVDVFSSRISVTTGDQFEITILVSNLGNIPAENFAFHVEFPSEITIGGGNYSVQGGNAVDLLSCLAYINQIDCAMNYLNPDGQVIFVVNATANNLPRPATTTIELTDLPDIDVDPRNNSDSVTVNISLQ